MKEQDEPILDKNGNLTVCGKCELKLNGFMITNQIDATNMSHADFVALLCDTCGRAAEFAMMMAKKKEGKN